MASSSDSVNLLEQLPELRETFYLLDYWFIMKEYNSGTARWKKYIGQSMGKGHWASMPSLSTPVFPNLHVFTPPEALQILSFWFFRGLHCIGMID